MVTVSVKEGIELYVIQDEAFTGADIISHLKALRDINREKPLALFMDQAMIHRAKEVKPYFEQLNIRKVFNIGYSPELNPIENCFSQAKRHYCRMRLNMLANNKPIDRHALIEESLAKITPELIKACAKRSDYLLRTF